MILFLSDGTPTGVSQGIFEIKEGKVRGTLLSEMGAKGEMDIKMFEEMLTRGLYCAFHEADTSKGCFPPGTAPSISPGGTTSTSTPTTTTGGSK